MELGTQLPAGPARAVLGPALAAAEATRPLLARRGRASVLGERSVGHVDPGARSAALIVVAICDALEG
jgi:dihydroxyacetone kinase-like protein